MRGEGPVSLASSPDFGVSPACAGNSVWTAAGLFVGAGQPCVCGEQGAGPCIGDSACGSSLRVRGTVHLGRPATLAERVIPACAGNRPTWVPGSDKPPGHPCVCGEQSSTWSERSVAYGSSLRVRGTVERQRGGPGHGRVIPACAGNRAALIHVPIAFAGHPCVCGNSRYS